MRLLVSGFVSDFRPHAARARPGPGLDPRQGAPAARTSRETRLAQTLEAASGGPVTAFEAAAALPWTRRQRKLTELDTMN
jgi:hypothetical protein